MDVCVHVKETSMHSWTKKTEKKKRADRLWNVWCQINIWFCRLQKVYFFVLHRSHLMEYGVSCFITYCVHFCVTPEQHQRKICFYFRIDFGCQIFCTVSLDHARCLLRILRLFFELKDEIENALCPVVALCDDQNIFSIRLSDGNFDQMAFANPFPYRNKDQFKFLFFSLKWQQRINRTKRKKYTISLMPGHTTWCQLCCIQFYNIFGCNRKCIPQTHRNGHTDSRTLHTHFRIKYENTVGR